MAIITDGVRTKFTDDTGLPLIGGQVFSYVEGTSTPKDTYQDRAFTIPNTNPIILDDVGSCQMYLNGGYRLRVLTADGVLVEEKDNAFQSDGQVLDVVANTTAIAALQTNVDVLNTRGGLKTDENNHIIGQGKAESATVYDLSLRSDKIRVSAPTDVEFGSLVFKTYAAPTVVNGVTIPKGTWLNPDLVNPLLGLGTAARKNVGTGNGQLIEADKVAAHVFSTTVARQSTVTGADGWQSVEAGFSFWDTLGAASYTQNRYMQILNLLGRGDSFLQFNFAYIGSNQDIAIRYKPNAISAASAKYQVLRTSGNTTVDGSGFIKAASPIVKVFADKVELNDDAVNQNVTYKKNGIGDYTITTASGLSTDGWYIELPKDMHGNPKVAVGTLDDTDGVITLKTYKRIFSMETFTFEPDLEQPLDIPETRWIDLRLNENTEQSE